MTVSLIGQTSDTDEVIMRILYLSCHSVLESDEVRLFSEMGHEVFSMGAYSNPKQNGLPRPALRGVKYYPDLYKLALQCSKENIHPQLIEWADVIIMMHNSRVDVVDHPQPWLEGNWEKIKHKTVIWRSIGQSVGGVEASLHKFRAEGLNIVRYSPMEENIPEFAGSDAMIRFSKDASEFKGWTGHKKQVITIAQSIKDRKDHLNYHVFERATKNLPRKVFGVGNENLGDIWGGPLSFDQLINEYRFNRVFFYTGTIPASYTLSFMEAMMTGIPIVAIGPKLFNKLYKQKTYEVHKLIRHGETGFVSDDVGELRHYVTQLLEDDELAESVSGKARSAARGYFGKMEIAAQWNKFFDQLAQKEDSKTQEDTGAIV